MGILPVHVARSGTQAVVRRQQVAQYAAQAGRERGTFCRRRYTRPGRNVVGGNSAVQMRAGGRAKCCGSACCREIEEEETPEGPSTS